MYGPGGVTGYKPQVGMQFNKQKLAVVVGYDTGNKSFGFGIVIPFGR